MAPNKAPQTKREPFDAEHAKNWTDKVLRDAKHLALKHPSAEELRERTKRFLTEEGNTYMAHVGLLAIAIVNGSEQAIRADVAEAKIVPIPPIEYTGRPHLTIVRPLS